MTLILVCLLGAGLFLWPFLGSSMPTVTPALLVALGSLGGLVAFELGTRRLDSRGLALLAALSAADAALRAALVTGIGGFSPIFLLVLCGGYAMGPEFGFLLGAGSLLTSALATGGLGPWLPYELFALGWVGAAAGVVGSLRRRHTPGWTDVAILGVVGLVAGFGYGAVMDVWNWTFYAGSPQLGWHPGLAPAAALARFTRYYLVTSLGYDLFRAIGNLLMVGMLGLPILAGLRRAGRRFQVEWEDDGTGPQSAVAGSARAQDVAAGDLVVPALAVAVHRGPGEPRPQAGHVNQVPHRPKQAAAEAEAATVLLPYQAQPGHQHPRGPSD